MTYLTTCGLGPPRVCLLRKGTLFASKGHGYLGKPFLNCHDRLMPQMGSAILASRSTIKEATSKQVQPELKKSSTKLLSTTPRTGPTHVEGHEKGRKESPSNKKKLKRDKQRVWEPRVSPNAIKLY